MIEQRWSLKKDLQGNNKKDKEDRDKEEGFKNSFRESQEEIKEETSLSIFY